MLALSDKGLAATALRRPRARGKTPVLTDARRGYSPLRGMKKVTSRRKTATEPAIKSDTQIITVC
jgi:hypothetical protein